MSRRKSVKVEPRFEFIPEDKWGRLSNEERSVLRKYRTHYRWVKEWNNLIDQKDKEIDQLKKKVDRKLYDMNILNEEIDHIRDTYDFSVSFICHNKYKNKKGILNKYYSVCLTFRGGEKKTRLIVLGSEDKIKKHMLECFKKNPLFKHSYNLFKKKLTNDFKSFMTTECKMGEIYEVCFDKLLEDPKGFKNNEDHTKLTLNDFYPVPTK